MVLLQAELATTRTFAAGWILAMLGRNVLLMVAVFGFCHLMLYVWKAQGTRGKYHPAWQQKDAAKFLFRDQVKDNMFWSIVSGATIWTAWEVFYVWMAGNGLIPLITFSSNPIWFVAMFLLIRLWRETHFYFVHKLLHWKPLLRAVHSLHHKNPNPGPWSGMSMHPVEHILTPNPHVLQRAAHRSHAGAGTHRVRGTLFGRILPAGDYFHYLHHKYVSCNFGAANVPWDKLLGRFHDGEGNYRTKQ